jgi:hypothetical protein
VFRRALRFGLVFLGALVLVAGLAWGVGFSGPATAEPLARRDLFLAMLTLGVLAIAVLGFDMREWF